MGNSEVGHLTIGAGRVVFQDLVRVNLAIEDGSFFDNEALCGAFERARERGGIVHLLGLVSYGGVHSHIDHLRALLELARREGMADRTVVHAFTDGRDVSPHAAASDLAELVREGAPIGTVVGRYYAMDRDGRWERTELAYEALVNGRSELPRADSGEAAVRAAYERGVVFDVGHASRHFTFANGRACLDQGLAPHVISTDIHGLMRPETFLDLPTALTKFLALGLSLEQVIAAATVAPARAIGWDDRIGRLEVGRVADVAVLELADTPVTLRDCVGAELRSDQQLKARWTIRAGQVVEQDSQEAP
jgi:hypothetical protein